MTEAELKEKVAQEIKTRDRMPDEGYRTSNFEFADQIHQLYLDAGYVQLTRDEVESVFHSEDVEGISHLPDSLEAELKSRLEVKDGKNS